MRERKLIFLDIDGVMNSDAWRGDLEEAQVRHSKMSSREISIEDNPCASHIAVLNELSKQIDDLEIVISSSWRSEMSWLGWNRFFATIGCEIPVTGVTGFSKGRRGTEVLKYLIDEMSVDSEDSYVFSFVVLDDDFDPDWSIVRDSWVLVDSKAGLIPEDADRISRVLSKKRGLPLTRFRN
jgi:hypothetical protein